MLAISKIHTFLLVGFLIADTIGHFARCDKLLVHFYFNQFTNMFSRKVKLVDEVKCSKSQENRKGSGIKLKSMQRENNGHTKNMNGPGEAN